MTSNEIKLRQLAAELSRGDERITKVAVRERIKGLKFEKDGVYDKYDQRVDAAYAFAVEFRAVRERRELERNTPAPPTVDDRYAKLGRMKRDRFLNCVQRCGFPQAPPGRHLNLVNFTEAEVKVVSWVGDGPESEHRYFIRPDWTSQVEARGLAVLDGKLTLFAGPEQEVAGVRVFPAVWATGVPPLAVESHRGFVARNGEFSLHAETMEDAVRKVGGHRRLK